MSNWSTVISEYAKLYEHDAGLQAFFMLAQDAIDVLADKPDPGLLVSDKQSAGTIGMIAALMDLRHSVDSLTAAVQEVAQELGCRET
jgi:hypothetical protein